MDSWHMPCTKQKTRIWVFECRLDRVNPVLFFFFFLTVPAVYSVEAELNSTRSSKGSTQKNKRYNEELALNVRKHFGFAPSSPKLSACHHPGPHPAEMGAGLTLAGRKAFEFQDSSKLCLL